ncbi:MAG: LLM class flavin-dependent oxidoreductase [Pseudomonas sp.]
MDEMTATAIDTGLPSDRGGKDLGIFMPMANGGWILSSTTPRLDGSYAYNRQAALLAERHGLDFIMAMAKWRGFGGATEHWRHALESQMLMAGLAEATRRVKVWATVHTLLQNPAVTAKMIATLDHISGGRAGLNLVTGSFKDEFEQMGAWRDDVDHDQRYDLADEWIHVIKQLWSQPSVDFDGRYFHMQDCQSDPKPLARPHPFLVCAGTSPKGMRFTVERMDAIFLGGSDLAELGARSRQAKAMAAASGRSIKTYSMINLVLGATDAEAQAREARYREGFDEGAFRGMLRAYGFLDTEIGQENAFTRKARTGFIAEHAVGAPDTVATHLAHMLEDCQLDGLMLIFPDYLEGIPLFGARILPQLRARFPERA